MPTTWLALEDAIDPHLLTVQAQVLPPEDRGDVLLWDTFCPPQDVDSVELHHVTTLDYRPAADRREWNARGRLIPAPTPPRRRVSIVPIEARDRLDEQELQRLNEGANGNAQTLRDLIGVTIPQRVDRLVDSVYRRLELDFVKEWTTGTIIQRNPENAAQTYTASFGFSSTRLTTAITAWNDAGVNAYDLLLAWISAAEDLVGPIKGVMLRRATFNVILADAPNLQNSVRMTRVELESRLTDDLGKPFSFYVHEQSVDIFDDGGTAYTRTKVWPANYIAAVPSDGRIGQTAFAPVLRAGDVDPSAGGPGGVNQRRVIIYREVANGGRELMIEAQLNALPIIDEQRLYVTNVGA